MDFELVAGSAIGAIWAVVFIWAAGRIAVSAWRGKEWKPTQAAGLIGSAAFSSGLVLFVKNALPHDTIGIGAVLALAGGVVLTAVGLATDRDTKDR
jgi:hypothetical protein